MLIIHIHKTKAFFLMKISTQFLPEVQNGIPREINQLLSLIRWHSYNWLWTVDECFEIT